jgi:lipid-binding SYLF domain-containing protein
MKYSFQKRLLGLLSMALMLCLSATFAFAQRNKRFNDAERHSQAAAETFTEIMGIRDKGIPKDLLDKAEAIMVFPGVVKAAFGIGGQGGQGVISRRIQGGWSAPAFFNLGGASIGAQIGAQKTDYVLLIMNDDGLSSLLKDKFDIGGEASIAAGPVGRTANASTDVRLTAGILSYSRTKGAFVGISLSGGTISPDNDLNEAVYDGKKAREVLTPGMSLSSLSPEVRAAVQAFPTTLRRYSRR